MRGPPRAAAVVGNKIVVAGGRTGDPGKLVMTTEIYNGTSWHDSTPITVPGDHVAAASDGTYLYAVGGAKLTSAINTAAVQRFNPATGQWTQLTHLQTAANAVGAAVVDGQLITFGGSNLGTVFNTVRAYNLTTKTWSSLPHMPQARQGMGVAVIGNDIYAIDGAAQPGHHAPTSTVQVLTAPAPSVQLAGVWRKLRSTLFPVEMVPAAVVGGRIWVVGGLTGPEQSTNKMEFYDPTLHTWGSGPPLPIALSHAMMVGYQHTAVGDRWLRATGQQSDRGRLGPGADPQQEPGRLDPMALRCIMRGPPLRPQWWGTRSSWRAGGPATPGSWS